MRKSHFHWRLTDNRSGKTRCPIKAFAPIYQLIQLSRAYLAEGLTLTRKGECYDQVSREEFLFVSCIQQRYRGMGCHLGKKGDEERKTLSNIWSGKSHLPADADVRPSGLRHCRAN
jgi:hypothetical protein